MLKNISSYKPSGKGFSLIELLVTVAVFGILVAVSLPTYKKYTQEPIKTAMKIELAELAKFLEYALSVDGAYHDKIYTMGYRPSKNLMAEAGFNTTSNPRNKFLNQSTVPCGFDMDAAMTIDKQKYKDAQSVESATAASHICDAQASSCEKDEKTMKQGTSYVANPTQIHSSLFSGVKENSGSCHPGALKKITVDCNSFLIGASAYVSSSSKADTMTVNEKGAWCYYLPL